MIAPASKQSAHPLQYKRIVIDDHNQLAIGCIHKRMSGGGRFADFRPRGNARHRDGKAGSLPQYRRQTHRMVEQPAQPVNNGKPETKTRTRCAKAIELTEDVLLLVLRNPRSGVPNLDTQVDTPLAATDDHAATAGVAYGIRNQIENDALQQDEVAAYPGAVGNDSQR